MFFEDFVCDVKILTVLKLSWDCCNAQARPRDFHALSFRCAGDAVFKTEKDKLNVKSGDILYVPENLGYHIFSKQYEELYAIHFKTKSKNSMRLELINVPSSARVNALFSSCYDVWLKKEPGYEFKALSIFYAILQLMAVSLSTDENQNYLKIKPALDYLQLNFCDPSLNVQTLAKTVYMSDTYFRKQFFAVFGTTPVKYINRLRISFAKDLIETGLYKIETVAHMCGFTDSKYFSTVFKEYSGFSPKDYKNR